MSNPLSVRRVKVQTIDEHGNPEGEPMFGVMAADNNAQSYCDIYPTIEDLNQAIDTAGSILKIVDEFGELFPEADYNKIGTDNYYGKDWNNHD